MYLRHAPSVTHGALVGLAIAMSRPLGAVAYCAAAFARPAQHGCSSGCAGEVGSLRLRGGCSPVDHRKAAASARTRPRTPPRGGVRSCSTSSDDPDLWGKWEFGTWVQNSYKEAVAEKEARIQPPASLPREGGASAGLQGAPVEDLDRALEILTGFAQEKRLARLKDVLDNRTESACFCFENPANPNNVWAALRTLDAFGVQHVHVIADPEQYRKRARLQTMCAAMGSQKWLSLHGHDTAEDAVVALRDRGYQVVASDLSPSSVPIGEVDWSRKTAVVMGNEDRGISPAMRGLADATFHIPMRGFAESFNLSVACSVILSHLSVRGGLRAGDLGQAERQRLMVKWLMQSVRGAEAILRREGIDFPPEALAGEGLAGYSIQ